MEEKQRVAMDVVRFSHIGISFLACILLPVLGGWWLDGRMGTGVLWTLVGAAFGFATGLYYLVVQTWSLE